MTSIETRPISWRVFAANPDPAMGSEAAQQAVGITDAERGQTHIAWRDEGGAIADRLMGLEIAHLQHAGSDVRHRLDIRMGRAKWTATIETVAGADEIEMVGRIEENTGAVRHAERYVWQGRDRLAKGYQLLMV